MQKRSIFIASKSFTLQGDHRYGTTCANKNRVQIGKWKTCYDVAAKSLKKERSQFVIGCC